MFKRIGLFIMTNIAIMLAITIVFSVLGMFGIRVNPSTVLGSLFMSAIVGFTGSIISLLMSRTMALRSVGGQIITEPRNQSEAWLLQTVQRLADDWHLQRPDVAIYDSPEPNAFATGARRNHALIAVSTGLLNMMTKDEVEAVLGHEMAHIGNGDMITMTLIQGVVNTFVYFLARIVASILEQALAGNRTDDDEPVQSGGMVYMLVNMVLQMVFGFLASFIVMWFSRQREYRADAGSARFVGAGKMISALRRLQSGEQADLPQQLSVMGISGGRDSLLATHPSLDNRIARLQNMQ